MSQRINICATVLLVLFELTTSAMVLPRPPSSPNHIHQDQELSVRKSLEGKSLHGVSRNTNVERPDVEDYRYRFANDAAFSTLFFFCIADRYWYYIPRPSHVALAVAIHFRFTFVLKLQTRSKWPIVRQLISPNLSLIEI